ncbi:MAG TPA: DUF1800 family protein [Burkholderiaceae bacterium]|nr:DUF1800 family protein [Burkholderiaceae bacterium]
MEADSIAPVAPAQLQAAPSRDELGRATQTLHPAASALAAAEALVACGGGGGGDSGGAAPPSMLDTEASRFLAQASMGASRAQIERVKSLGFAGWLDEQFALPPQDTRWDWLVANGFNDPVNQNNQAGFDAAAWRKLLASPDTLRQRVTLALSEILVVGIDGLVNGGGWRAFSAAAYLDLLEANAFGTLRNLLDHVSRSLPMGLYLTFRNNPKANVAKGTSPDENYARELMQLFTIGLLQLNDDGTPKSPPVETYGQSDITGLARVFTGWNWDLAGGDTSTPDYQRRPMIQVPANHELGTKTFLGTTIPGGTAGAESLRLALDAIYAHPNVPPFWSRQLIQRLVTSNPSPPYVKRVAAVFADDGAGVRGNLQAVLRAILLDDEARNSASLGSDSAGKLREPMLRLTGWARAFSASSASGAWAVPNTSDPGTRLAQSPLRSASVFNFFRPGYVPPNSAIGSAALVAPEFQLTNESSSVGYINFMQRVVANGAALGDVKADYSSVLPLADDAAALLAELNVVLAGGQISGATLSSMQGAVGSMPAGTDAARSNRIYAALTMVLAAPEYLVLK